MFRPNVAIIRFSSESMVVVLYRIGVGMSRLIQISLMRLDGYLICNSHVTKFGYSWLHMRGAPVFIANSESQLPTGITIQSSRFWNSVEGRTWSCIPCVSGCVPSGRHFWTHKNAILKCKLRDLDSEGVDVGLCSPDVENWWRRRHVLLGLSYLLIQRTCYISTAKSQEARRKAKHK